MQSLPETSTSHYSNETRLEACALYVVHGKFSKITQQLGIPKATLSNWSQQDWWQEHTERIRTETKATTLAWIDKIVEKGLEETMDRLEHGDVVMTKEGQQRMPMKGKDTATVSAIMIDKRQILLNQPTSIRGESQGMEALAEQFKQLAARMDEKVVSSD